MTLEVELAEKTKEKKKKKKKGKTGAVSNEVVGHDPTNSMKQLIYHLRAQNSLCSASACSQGQVLFERTDFHGA